ncbi:calcineurin-like phosphoesterase [Aureococcus anophagefferens]|nr:calcineurin-like phosphoesterase [Aureococcus anophagefferens]
MLALLLLLRAAAATTDDVVVQRGAVDHATVAALAADIAGQPAAKGWMAVPGAVAALLGDAGAVKAPYRVAAGAVEAHRDTEDGAPSTAACPCGGARLLGYAFDDANACANRAAATKTCGAHLQYSPRVDEVGCWCCPEAFEPPATRRPSSLYEIRACDAPTAAPSDAPSFSPTPYPSPSCGFYATLFSATFLPSGAAWASARASVFYGTWDADRDPATNPLIATLAYPFPDLDYLCVAPGCYTLVFEGDADGLRFTIASPVADQTVTVETSDLAFCTDEEGHFDRAPTAAPTATASPSRAPSAGGLAPRAVELHERHGAQVLPYGDAYVIAALDGGSGTYRVNRYLDVPSGAQVNAVAMALVTSGFGAAWAFGKGAARAFFAENAGLGVFEVLFPLTVPETYWNFDDDEDDDVYVPVVPATSPTPTPRPTAKPTDAPADLTCLAKIVSEGACDPPASNQSSMGLLNAYDTPEECAGPSQRQRRHRLERRRSRRRTTTSQICGKRTFIYGDVWWGTICNCCTNSIINTNPTWTHYDIYTYDCDFPEDVVAGSRLDDCPGFEPCEKPPPLVCPGTIEWTPHAINDGAVWAPSSLKVADLDGDCCVDFVVTDCVTEESGASNSVGNRVSTYRNDCAQNFTEILEAYDFCPAGSDIGDIDGDCDLDVVATVKHGIDRGRQQGDVNWYENWEATFVAQRPVSGAPGGVETPNYDHNYPWGVEIVDVDGDGDQDVVVSDWGDGHVQWYENSGGPDITFALHGSATPPRRPTPSSRPTSTATATSTSSPAPRTYAMTLFENLDALTWTAHAVATPDTTYGVSVADVDGDDDLDLLSSSHEAADDAVCWFSNLGGLAFDRACLAGSAEAFSVAAADLDGDDDMDIISGETAWYENDGAEGFSRRFVHATPNGAAVVVADVDGDGDLDIAAVSMGRADFDFEDRDTYECQYLTDLGQAGFAGDCTGFISWFENDCSIATLSPTAGNADGGSGVEVVWRGPSDEAGYNDGVNCQGDPPFASTPFPTLEPTDYRVSDLREYFFPTAAPSVSPSLAPTPYPSPDCAYPSHAFAAEFLPSGADWGPVTASVYWGTWDEERDVDMNPLITQLSHPFPDVDYLCIFTGATRRLRDRRRRRGLSFTISSESDSQHLSLDGSDGTETMTINGTQKLALCADADTGEFNHAPTAAPSLSMPPSYGPSQPPSYAPSATPSTYAPSATPSMNFPTVSGDYCAAVAFPAMACSQSLEFLGFDFVDANACAHGASRERKCAGRIHYSATRNDEYGCWCCDSDALYVSNDDFDVYDVVLCGDPSAAPSSMPLAAPTAAPTSTPSAPPSFLPTPYPSPDCAYPSHTFAAEFLPSGKDWAQVTASVYWGTWDEERDVDMNPLITQLSHPFPDVDYLCIFTGCYTLVFEIDGVAEGLSFTISSESDSQHLSLDGSDGTETMTINGTQKLALCADADTGEFNHAPTATPTLSLTACPGDAALLGFYGSKNACARAAAGEASCGGFIMFAAGSACYCCAVDAFAPSAAPTYPIPSPNPTPLTLAWSTRPHNCSATGAMLRPHKVFAGGLYTVVVGAPDAVAYDVPAGSPSPTSTAPRRAFRGRGVPLMAIFGGSRHYAYRPGAPNADGVFYRATGIYGLAPTLDVASDAFAVSSALFDGAVGDVAALVEDGDDLIVDGVAPTASTSSRRRPFDCGAHSNPIQVLKFALADTKHYVMELNLDTGEYEELYNFEVAKVNGYATVSSASSGPSSATPTTTRATCGAENIGPQWIYTVFSIGQPAPVFSERSDLILRLRRELWYEASSKGNIYDWASLVTKIVVVKIDEATGQAGSYAVIPVETDWNGQTPVSGWSRRNGGSSPFGAAFTYQTDDYDRVFFTSNDAWGLFELELPFRVNADCWNSGLDNSAHVTCHAGRGPAAWITYRMKSEETYYNDGMNCHPYRVAIDETLAPAATFRPTTTPYPSRAPSTAAPSTVRPSSGEPSRAPSTAEPSASPTTLTRSSPVDVGSDDDGDDDGAVDGDDAAVAPTPSGDGGRRRADGGARARADPPSRAPSTSSPSFGDPACLPHPLELNFSAATVARDGNATVFQGAGRWDDVSVDVAVAAADGSEVAAGVVDAFAIIDVPKGGSQALTLSFSSGGVPLAVGSLYLTFVSVDASTAVSEVVCVDGADAVVAVGAAVDATASAFACDGGPGASTSFASTAQGFDCDDPSDPYDLDGAVACAGCFDGSACGALGDLFPVVPRDRSAMVAFVTPRSSVGVAVGAVPVLQRRRRRDARLPRRRRLVALGLRAVRGADDVDGAALRWASRRRHAAPSSSAPSLRPSPLPTAAPTPECPAGACLYAVVVDADAFEDAGVAMSLWVDHYLDGAPPPRGEALVDVAVPATDTTHVCLADGCFTARFDFSRKTPAGLAFEVRSSGRDLVQKLKAANASTIQRYYFASAPAPSPAPLPAPTVPPSPSPSFLPTPYPSPECAPPSNTFAAEFLPSGAAWANVTASVYVGSWDDERDEAANPLITRLSHPFPNVDYLCIVSGCYTLVFEIDGAAEGLSFTISSESDFEHISLDGTQGTEVTAIGTNLLALCADGPIFDHSPSSAPTVTTPPSFAPIPPGDVPAAPRAVAAADLRPDARADGRGPAAADGAALRLANVGIRANGRPFDVVVAVEGSYGGVGGVDGDFLTLTVDRGASTTFAVRFEDSATGNPADVHRLYVTLVDVDGLGDVSEAACLEAADFDGDVLGDDVAATSTKRRATAAAGASTTFASTADGYGCDDPSDAFDLGVVTCEACYGVDACASSQAAGFPVDQAARAVMWAFTAPRSSFDVVLSAPCPGCAASSATRTFKLAGASSLAPCLSGPSAAPSGTGARALADEPAPGSALILESSEGVTFAVLGDGTSDRYDFCMDGCAFDHAPTPAPSAVPSPAPSDYWATCQDAAYEIHVAGRVSGNNLGGIGPDGGDPVLRYASVTEKDGRDVDLVVSVAEGYDYAAADNFATYHAM